MIGNTIKSDFERPDPLLVSLFEGIPVANIDDCVGRTRAVCSSVKPIGYKGPLLGTAFTIRLPKGDNLMLHAAMDLMKPGDVVVIEAGGETERAIFGELMASYMKSRGVKGVLLHGAVRDAEALEAMEDFRVYASGVTPNGPFKEGPGEVNVPIEFAGQTVFPGDIVTADRDGAMFIRPEDAVRLSEEARRVQKKEEAIYRDIVENSRYVRPWVEEKLREIGTERV